MIEAKDIKSLDEFWGWLRAQKENPYAAMNIVRKLSFRAAARMVPYGFMVRDYIPRQPVILWLARAVLSCEVSVRHEFSPGSQSLARVIEGHDYTSGYPQTVFSTRMAKMALIAASTTDPELAIHNFEIVLAGDLPMALTAMPITGEMIVRETMNDAALLEQGNALDEAPLWSTDAGRAYWSEIRAALGKSKPVYKHSDDKRAEETDWSFWIDWYEGVLTGNQMSLDLLQEIVLIDNVSWSAGSDVVNPIISEIYSAFLEKRKQDDLKAPVAGELTISQIQTAVVQNRQAIPLTFEVIDFLIVEEIRRLQGKNYFQGDLEREECQRQIRLLTEIHTTASGLAALVPVSSKMTETDAEKACSLVEVYLQRLRAWPRENAPEMVDNTVRLGLIAGSTGLLTMFGAPATVAASIAGLTFGGKKLATVAKDFIAATNPSS